MKTTTAFFGILFLCLANSLGQELKEDTRRKSLMEDGFDYYRVEQTSELDIIQALEVAGIRIYKFMLGDFDKKYNFILSLDEYVEGNIINTDTLIYSSNEYHYFEKGKKDYFLDYIDQIKIFTKVEDGKIEFHIKTYKISFKKKITYQKKDEDQFYNLRNYTDTKWVPEHKVPLLVYASSWEDKKYGFQRFCGVTKLSENDDGTEELLSLSPHYFVISYKVTEIEN